MDTDSETRSLDASLAERLLREAMRTPPLKEAMLLYIRDINPGTAPGLARAVLWEDPALFMSLFGAMPDAVNWLLGFLTELGKQLDGLPEPLLREFAETVAERVDTLALGALPALYGPLLKRLLAEDGRAFESIVQLSFRAINAALAAADEMTAGIEEDAEQTAATAIARGLDGLDTGALGRVSARMLRLANDARRLRRGRGRAVRSLLERADPRDACSMGGAFARGFAAAAALFLVWSVRGVLRRPGAKHGG